MKKNYNNSNLKDASRIIRDGGGVTSDRHLTGWVRFAHTAPYRKCGFTLAEVLITLAIVGVVAAITMPALIANIQDRVKTARIQNITQKFGKATDKMKSLSTLGGYATTMDFVNELQKHLKIAKVCDNQHLTECWPTETVMLDDEKEWEISQTKTGKQLKMENNDTHEYGNTVGIVTADGTAMILTYNAKCDIDEAPVTWSNNQSSTSGCVAAVFDWNGSKMPNKLSNDIVLFNANGLGSNAAFYINGIGYTVPKIVTPLSPEECNAIKVSHGINECGGVENDSFAGAAKVCGHVKNMISDDALSAMASELNLYVKNEYGSTTYNYAVGRSLGFPDPIFEVPSSTESNDEGAISYTFASTLWKRGRYMRYYGTHAICKAD